MSRLSTRDRILDAALSVFAGKGYHRATVDDFTGRLAAAVARAIGTRQGALAKVEGSIPALDTRVATLGWLDATIPALTKVLLRSIGAGKDSSGVRASLRSRKIPR